MNKDFKKVIWSSIKRSFKGKLWGFLLGSFPSLIAILLFGKTFLDATMENSIIIGVSFLGLILFIRMAAFLFRDLSAYSIS